MAIVKINDKTRIIVTEEQLTLQKMNGIDKDNNEIWVGQKYFSKWEHALNYLKNSRLVELIDEKESISLNELLDYNKQAHEEIKTLLKV